MTNDIELLDSTEARTYAAKECQQLLGHQAWIHAVEATERRIKAEWERGATPLEREMAWYKFQAFKTLQAELRSFASRTPLTIA